MYFDAVTMTAIRDELTMKLLDGRVQALVEVDDLSLGMEIYARQQRNNLYLSAHPQRARVQLMDDKLRRGATHPSPLGLLLKKYLIGSRLIEISQPPHERILHLSFSGEEGDVTLIAEIMDRRSNIILTVGDLIMDSIKRIGKDQNRYRVTLPNKLYIPPPPIRKMPPAELTSALMKGLLMEEPAAYAWKALVKHLSGISPLLARELAFRAAGEIAICAADISPTDLLTEIEAFLNSIDRGDWRPGVCHVEEGSGYTAFAAYPITHLKGWEPRPSISAAVTDYFGAPVSLDAYAPAKETVAREVKAALLKMEKKLSALRRQLKDADEIDRLRISGELIYAYSYQLAKGDAELIAQYDVEAQPLSIKLDTDLIPVENAQRYFERYEKAKKAFADLPVLVKRAELEWDYLQQLKTDLDLAENWPEIDEVREALVAGGYWQGRRTKTPRSGKPGIRRYVSPDGFVILVGRNAAQNHTLVTEKSQKDDLWLHAHGLPGSHVIIQKSGREVSDQALEQAAKLAAYFSAGRTESSIRVDITERRYVRPIKGARPGQVTYRNERTLTVKPAKP